MNSPISVKQLPVKWITPDNFKPYGQVIFATPDKKYDDDDAKLNLSNGIPRFYIMRLTNRVGKFHKIARHVQCTQCLGSLEGKDWFIAVAPPSDTDKPTIEGVAAFRVPGNCFIKLELGTWHFGPLCSPDYEFIDFYNLELTDTNEVDLFTHDFHKDNLEFEIVAD
ncbi:MAG: Ureidoglycolate hydrolase [Oscillatoria sp. SIO1A7]|nr:Ureidoglycolate hydrolase [Oscillatoria sp. SIO1A7]